MMTLPDAPTILRDAYRCHTDHSLALTVFDALQHIERLLDEHQPAWVTLTDRQIIGEAINQAAELEYRHDTDAYRRRPR